MNEGKQRVRLRSVRVISEMALACVLLVGAGLFMRSFLRVPDVDLDFEPGRAAVIKRDYNDDGNLAQRSAILKDMLKQVSAVPGVEAAGITDMLPLFKGRDFNWRDTFRQSGLPELTP